MNPFDGQMNPQMIARYLQSPGRLANVMKEEMPGWEATPGEIMADIINVHRADVKAIADALDVDDDGEPVDVELMSEDRAADLIAGVTQGDAVDFVVIFNELARKRDLVLAEVLDDDAYQQFMANKTSVMYTDDPDTWQDDGADQAVAADGGDDIIDVDGEVIDEQPVDDEQRTDAETEGGNE